MRLSLNLLPPDRKQALRASHVFAYSQTILVLFLILSVIATATIFSVRLLVAATYADLTGRSTTITDEYKQLTSDIKEINAYLTRVEAFDRRAATWSEILKKIGSLTPAGTRLSHIAVLNDGKVQLTGEAQTRADVLMFGERLTGDGAFIEVKSPLSNILQQRNVKFDFEMRLAGWVEAKKP